MSRHKIKRPKEEVSRLLAEWSTSGLSARAFGEREAIPVSTLYQWARRTRNKDTTTRRSRPGGQFIAIDVGGEASGAAEGGGFRVVLPAGREVEVSRGFDADELARLVRVLEA